MYHYGRKQLAAASADRESGDGPTFDSQIKELLSSAADAAHKSITRESRRDRRPAVEATAAVPGGLSALAQSLIDFFPSVRHWLAATSIVDKLVELGNLTLKSPASAADEERIAILCEALNFVYPTYVNAFVKEVVEARLSRNRNALENALLAILKGDVGGGRLLKASACYIVGRMRDSFTEFRPMLRQVITFTHRDLAEIEVLQQAVLAAKRNNATKCLVAFEKIVDALCGSGGPVDPLQKLDRGQKELLLLQRSAYISLGNLEDSQAAEEYIISLLADAQRDDLNRGFHLEYYGDLDYLPVDPLFSTDKKRGPWPRTLRALLTALSDGSHHVSAQMVPAVTLASLARHRHCYDNLQASDREKVLACLREVRRLRFPTRIAEFLESVIKELEHDMYVIERYVDDLYELKYQRRAGWEDLMPPESVAAHSYMAEFLAKLFVPDESSLDRQKVLEYIAFHDIGEAVTGDIVHGKKFAPERATEARIVRQISQLGALTRSAEFLRLAARFEMFEKTDGADLSDEVKLAKDCDHLDLLIQLFRYKRECADVPRFAEFRAYVEPSNFRSEEMKRWAARFVRYFERELEPPKVRGNGSLWLAEINRQRISGRPV
jgi:5'-deoxynucleotidase YfbR-like HD superfamily hydrolase